MSNFAAARLGYNQTGKQARVLGANAHQLVVILFDELLDLIDEMYEALSRDLSANITQQRVSATSILDALIASLDDGRANQIANNLHLIYRQSKVLIAHDSLNANPKNINAAREILREISLAWSKIG